MTAIKAFLAKYSITTHSLVGAVVTLTVLYNAVPAFHSLVVSAYSATPAWFHSIAAAVFGIWAFYQGSEKSA
jgi:hypothetical protein